MTKDLSVCHFLDGAREARGREITLGRHCTRGGGGDGSQDWDEGENSHGVKKSAGTEERAGSLETGK
jgi:hypothetical protein